MHKQHFWISHILSCTVNLDLGMFRHLHKKTSQKSQRKWISHHNPVKTLWGCSGSQTLALWHVSSRLLTRRVFLTISIFKLTKCQNYLAPSETHQTPDKKRLKPSVQTDALEPWISRAALSSFQYFVIIANLAQRLRNISTPAHFQFASLISPKRLRFPRMSEY